MRGRRRAGGPVHGVSPHRRRRLGGRGGRWADRRRGQTRRTTAHFSNAIDDLCQIIEKIHGRDGARLAAESHTAAVDATESVAAAEGISFDFERLDGYLFPAPGESPGLLRRERDAARRAGLANPILTLYERDEEREDAFEAIGAVRELLAMSICSPASCRTPCCSAVGIRNLSPLAAVL